MMPVRHRALLHAGLLFLAAIASTTAAAQQAQHEHGGQQPQPQAQAQHDSGGMPGMHGQAMGHMRQGMGMPMSGDQDVDFARMMIPHHEGAIDMARAQLERGKDPQLRRMAQEIIGAQEREIAVLKDWLAKHPK